MANQRGWKCRMCGTVYGPDEVVGQGNPPGCAKCAIGAPGTGRYEMEAIPVSKSASGYKESS